MTHYTYFSPQCKVDSDHTRNAVTAVRAELTGDDTCSALGITVQSTSPVLALCRKLVDAGHDPATPLDVYRADVRALKIRSIGEGVKLRVSPHGIGFVLDAPTDERQRRTCVTASAKHQASPALSRAPIAAASHRPSERPRSKSSHARSTQKD